MAANRLYRSRNRVLGGVLAGFAEYFSINVVLVRLIYVLLSLWYRKNRWFYEVKSIF